MRRCSIGNSNLICKVWLCKELTINYKLELLLREDDCSMRFQFKKT